MFICDLLELRWQPRPAVLAQMRGILPRALIISNANIARG
jgi:hypothetical protein